MKSLSTLKNLIEAIEDWDNDLAMDCLAELGDIIEDARVDSGRCVGELIGLRQALVSGLRSGTISAAASGQNDVEAPRTFNAQTLEADFLSMARLLPSTSLPLLCKTARLRLRTFCAMSSNTSSTKPMPSRATWTWFLCRSCTTAPASRSALHATAGTALWWNPTLLMFAPCAGTIRRRFWKSARVSTASWPR